jgi:ATP synthase subunit 6
MEEATSACFASRWSVANNEKKSMTVKTFSLVNNFSEFAIYTPLEQFNIKWLVPIWLFNYDISFTNSSLYLLITTLLIVLFFQMVTMNGGYIVPSRWQSVVEMIYEFVVSLVQEQIGEKGKAYFAWIFTTFVLLLFCNLIGMIPYSFTVTSHLVVTFGLSLSLFIGVTLIGFKIHGLHFFSFLLPKGAPLGLAPLLVVIELVSYCFRAVSLGVRLFANLMAGHCLLHILSGFAWTMVTTGGLLTIASVIPMAVVFAITGLEFCVAFLQAYVFCILLCIYINDAIALH